MYDAVAGVPGRNAGAVAHPFRLPASGTLTAKQLLSGGAFQVGKNNFEIRYRGVTLAQLDLRKLGIQGRLVDEAFRPYVFSVFSWLAERLNSRGSIPEAAREDAPPTAENLERWIRRPLPFLNDESPLQASSHDFGKRRLRDLIGEVSRRGGDVVMLRQRLGL